MPRQAFDCKVGIQTALQIDLSSRQMKCGRREKSLLPENQVQTFDDTIHWHQTYSMARGRPQFRVQFYRNLDVAQSQPVPGEYRKTFQQSHLRCEEECCVEMESEGYASLPGQIHECIPTKSLLVLTAEREK